MLDTELTCRLAGERSITMTVLGMVAVVIGVSMILVGAFAGGRLSGPASRIGVARAILWISSGLMGSGLITLGVGAVLRSHGIFVAGQICQLVGIACCGLFFITYIRAISRSE